MPSQENRAIKIGFIERTWTIGGAERIVQNVINRMDSRLFKAVILSLENAGIVGEELRAVGVPVYEKLASGWFDFKGIRKLAKIIDEEKLDVLHTFANPWSMFFAVTAGFLAKQQIKVVTGIHNSSFSEHALRKNISSMILCPWIPHFIALTERHRKLYSKKYFVNQKKISVIYNGIDTNRFNDSYSKEQARVSLGVPNDHFVVGIVAAFRPEKRHDIFIQAAKKLLETFADFSFVLVGDGALRPEIEKQIAKLGIGDNVLLTGNVPKPETIMAGFDAKVLCSESEVAPLTVLEAGAMAIPVIATDVGFVSELVIDGETGIIIPPNDVDALVNAILSLKNDPDKANKLGNAARERVTNLFSLEKMVQGYADFFRNIVSKPNCVKVEP